MNSLEQGLVTSKHSRSADCYYFCVTEEETKARKHKWFMVNIPDPWAEPWILTLDTNLDLLRNQVKHMNGENEDASGDWPQSRFRVNSHKRSCHCPHYKWGHSDKGD